MAETKPTEVPGVEVTEHWYLKKEDDGRTLWGRKGVFSSVDGARKFLYGSDQKQRFIEMGGVIVEPPDLILDVPQSWVAYGVVMPEVPVAE